MNAQAIPQKTVEALKQLLNTEDGQQLLNELMAGYLVVQRLKQAGLSVPLICLIAETPANNPIMGTCWDTVAIQLRCNARDNGLIPPRPTGWGTCVAQANWDLKFAKR